MRTVEVRKGLLLAHLVASLLFAGAVAREKCKQTLAQKSRVSRKSEL